VFRYDKSGDIKRRRTEGNNTRRSTETSVLTSEMTLLFQKLILHLVPRKLKLIIIEGFGNTADCDTACQLMKMM